MKEPLYILDCYAVIYRSYFAFINRPLKNPRGMNVSAVFGFFRALLQLIDERNPRRFAAVFDSPVPTFRHELFKEYKATRQKTPEDLHAQVPMVEEVLKAFGVPLLREDGFEADDLIASLAGRCRAEGRECWVISADKDLLQLVGGPVRVLRQDREGAWKSMGREEVLAEWGVPPEMMLDHLSLTGDASDNVPGVAGIGDKSAARLVAEFGDLDSIYSRLSEVKPEGLRKKLEEGRESAYFSRGLIKLREDAPLGIADIDELSIESIDRVAAAKIFLREGMKSLAAKAAPGYTGEGAQGGLFDQGSAAGEKIPRIQGGAGAEMVEEASKPSGAEAENAAGSSEKSGLFRLKPGPELLGKGEYETVLSEEALERWVRACKAAGTVAFDCETDSIDDLKAHPVGFSLSIEPKKACYVPIRAPDAACLSEERARAALKSILEDPGVRIIGQNIKYDYLVMENFGVKMGKVYFDTMIAAWLLDSGRSSYSLETLAELSLGYAGISYDEAVPKGATFDQVPIEKASVYAAEDADLTLRLYRLYEPALKEEGLDKLLSELEMPLLPILAGMEREGIGLESEVLASYSIELAKSLDSIEREIYRLVGHEFNIASTKQLQEVLFVERKLKTGKKTKTGYSTDTSVLEELAADDRVPELILKYRGLAKLKLTYVDSLPLLIGPDGRVHTHFIQTGAATGRLSSRDPNLQNIPIRDVEGRRIRKAFVAAQGMTLVSADYSQIELVVLAHLSGDPGLLQAFKEGADVHRRTASLIFGIPETEVSPERRRMAKTINFGVIYGMSAFRLSNEMKIPRKDAQSFIDAYFTTYKGVRELTLRTIEKAERDGFVTTISGRKRTIDAINSKNRTEKAGAERIAVNTPIQGSAADIVKAAMIRVSKALAAGRTGARLLLQVHDELILECPESQAEAVMALVKREMEASAELSLPLKVSVEQARSWGDMH